MEECIVVVCFGTDRIEGSSVEVAELLNELIAEVGALLVLLVIVKVDLCCISILELHLSSSRASYLDQHSEVRPYLRYLLFICLLRCLSCSGLSCRILGKKTLEDSPCWVAGVGESGADGYEDGGG